MEIVRWEGARTVKRPIDTYNLDMILSVGYCANSKNAMQFRIRTQLTGPSAGGTFIRVSRRRRSLLSLTVRNHSLNDGNKRIAAFLSLWFLENNHVPYRPDGSCLLDNNTLVALTLMIAKSRTEEKDEMTKVVVTPINKNN